MKLVFLSFVAYFVHTSSALQCTWDSLTGATFDLSSLVKSTPYEITDGDIPCTPVVEKNYTYFFDICQDVPKPSNSMVAQCPKSGAALQVDPTNPSNCFVAGQLGSQLSWSLIDSATPDPTKGVKLTYSSGEVCHTNNQARTTTLIFDCSNNAIPNPTTAYEVSHCQYQIHLSSFYGCPLECPIAGRQLCGGNGLCAYDKHLKSARCFCDSGFGGAACTDKVSAATAGSSSTSSAVIGLLVTVFIVSLGLAVALVVLVRQIRAYRQDATNYMQITGEEMMPTSNENI
jgi:hypothetical protein